MNRKQFAIALVVLFFFGLAGGAISNHIWPAPAVAEPIKKIIARELHIIDEQGKPKIILAYEKGMPAMLFSGSKDRYMVLGIADGWPVITIHGEKGRQVLLGIPEGLPSLSILDNGQVKFHAPLP